MSDLWVLATAHDSSWLPMACHRRACRPPTAAHGHSWLLMAACKLLWPELWLGCAVVASVHNTLSALHHLYGGLLLNMLSGWAVCAQCRCMLSC